MTLVGELVLVGVGDEAGVGVEAREEACFGTWPEVGVLAETKADVGGF